MLTLGAPSAVGAQKGRGVPICWIRKDDLV